MKTKKDSLTAGGFAHPEISQEPILIQHRTEPRIDSRLFAKRAGLQHRSLYKLIKNNIKQLREFGSLPSFEIAAVNIAANAYQVNDSLLAGNNSIWANRSLTKNLVNQSAKIYANQLIPTTVGGWDDSDNPKREEFTPFAKGDFSHLSKEANYPHWQDLSVTNSYSQKKKDSLHAVLIQLYPLEQVTRLPNNIGLAPRLPDYIGLVQYFLSSVGGWDLNRINNIYSVQRHNQVNDIHKVQPFGSMPFRNNSLRPRFLSQLAKLMLDCLASISNCSFSSGVILILNCGDCPSPLGLLSLLIVDKWPPIKLILLILGGHNIMVIPKKAMPRSAPTHTGHLTTNDRLSIEEAMKDHITPVTGRNSFTPNIKFLWRFFSCQQAKYISVEATNEQEARAMLPDSPCLFSARIRQGGGA